MKNISDSDIDYEELNIDVSEYVDQIKDMVDKVSSCIDDLESLAKTDSKCKIKDVSSMREVLKILYENLNEAYDNWSDD